MKKITKKGDEIKSNLLSHHAFYVIGGIEINSWLIANLESESNIQAHGNPDLFQRHYASFAIDDARELKELHNVRPISETAKKIFILNIDSFTNEAQNALLKLLEEPAEYAHFFLIIPSKHLLLPTVISRLALLETGQAKGGSNLLEAKEFIKLSPAKRIEMIKGLTEDLTKEKKTKQEIIEFLNNLQEVIYKEKRAKEGRVTLEAIEVARKYAGDRAPSLKMLLEYVAVNI
ncbi:MAG: hypothetical protein WCT02_02365 [Candidatus Paceibacterota bacterium]|jgi:DNA polymerase-3 subunit delta'